MKCETCTWWWYDAEDRIYANISTGHSNFARDRIELRRCKFIPHPSQDRAVAIYTDSDYVCSCWRQMTKE